MRCEWLRRGKQPVAAAMRPAGHARYLGTTTYLGTSVLIEPRHNQLRFDGDCGHTRSVPARYLDSPAHVALRPSASQSSTNAIYEVVLLLSSASFATCLYRFRSSSGGGKNQPPYLCLPLCSTPARRLVPVLVLSRAHAKAPCLVYSSLSRPDHGSSRYLSVRRARTYEVRSRSIFFF